LRTGEATPEIKDRENRSCLMWAVCAGNVEVIEYLVRKTSPDRQARDNHGFTALHLAAMVGNENICKVLVRQGWNLSERDKLDNTPLHLAAGRGHTDVVRFLVTAGANMNEKDAMDRTPVYWACFGGQAHTLYSCCSMLGTALHIACSRGKMDCVLALLKGGAAPNAVNDARKTCLQCAIDSKHSSVSPTEPSFLQSEPLPALSDRRVLAISRRSPVLRAERDGGPSHSELVASRAASKVFPQNCALK
uniref:ANK_REP_REGION domain-containing protein n=1 Tax=Heligmosomoides polygyrus TaxID=6339 RepID=A0A183GNN9_HELPZ